MLALPGRLLAAVSWHPPITLLSGLELPGPDLGHMEITEVHQGIRQGEAALQRTAEQLGTTIDALRHLLEKHPAPRGLRAGRQVRAATRMALPKNELGELYLNQRLSLDEIGRRVGASPQTISRLAHEYGISLRKGRRARTIIDRTWLYEQYAIHRRTLNDLAREAGMSATNMNRWAHTHQIPLRGGGGRCHQRNLRAPDEAMAAPRSSVPRYRKNVAGSGSIASPPLLPTPPSALQPLPLTSTQAP